MAFELRSSESARRGLRRLARRELGVARDQILGSARPGEEAIHTARKSVKKVRAIVGLIESADGRGLGRAARRLSRVNRTLSCVRDADAMIATLATLKSHHPELFSEHGYARIRRQLAKQKQHTLADAQRHAAWKDTARELRTLRKSARGWRTGAGGFAAVAPGIRAIFKRGRKALARAQETNGANDFHTFRKEMKALWYALRLIGADSAAVGRDIRALRRAERWLGDDHNLVVLCAELAKDPAVCRGPLDVHRLQCAVDAIQQTLRRKAIDRTHVIFSFRPRDYVARAERAWRARRHSASAGKRRAA